jgi:hypothetical protein
MTLQEIYDTVARVLIAQGRPSVTDGWSKNGPVVTCAYASPDGCRCAIGHLMNYYEVNAYGKFQGAAEGSGRVGWRHGGAG